MLSDVEIGTLVRQGRKARKITQIELAERMTELGFPWHQTAVAKTERGQRALKVTEALAIAKVFEEFDA